MDIGLGKNAFLYMADLQNEPLERKLHIGDSVVVQVVKEAEGAKGPRVTTDITLPGRFLVLLPFQNTVGVSRQISDEEERARLKALAEEIRPRGIGLIVRTLAQDAGEDELREDLEDLLLEWNRLQKKLRTKGVGPLLYQDHDLVYRILRDLYSPPTRIIVDTETLQRRVISELQELGLESSSVELYQGKLGIFTYLGLDKDLERARNPRVWLDCGGYLVINQTEALLTIDVNTGKYVGTTALKDTILRTNLEAAEEIARQLRLRNIGGIVIIDFIHMPDEGDREQVLARLADSLGADKTRTNLCGFTRLGLVELTRKKARRPLAQILEVDCPHCRGTGRVDSDETTAFRIAASITASAAEDGVEAVLVRCHPAVAAHLIGPGAKNLNLLEKQTGKAVFIRGDEGLPKREFELTCGDAAVLQEKALPVAVGDRITVEIVEPHAKNRGSGLARVAGYVIECLDCWSRVGQKVDVEVVEVYRTSALARLLENQN